MSRVFFFGLLLAAQVSTPQCDSSSSSGPGSIPGASTNVLPIAVNAGPTNNALNEAFATVTVCVPGTSNCQTIGGIVVDTGSEGLRVLSSALTLPLPQQTGAGGAPVVECLPFLDGFTWGPVQSADIKLAGEQANSVPIQVIGVDKFPTIPSSCSSNGVSEETLNDLGANGILGIGSFRQDCGPACSFTGASNPGLYYACPTPATCEVTAQALANQLQNPVWLFPSDNNGTAIQFPAAPTGGAPQLGGALVFGIGTQSNNALGSAKVFTVDASGNFTTTFNNTPYRGSFIDSGSNGIFFLDAAAAGLPACQNSVGFYCPPTLRALSATNTGTNGATSTVSFNAGNVDAINSTFSVFGETTGTNPGSFDWGLPFFYGRAVFTAIEGQSTPGGVGPYWAY